MLRVRNDGIPIVGFTWYSLTDQVDWDTRAARGQRPRQPARPVRPRPQDPAGRRGLQAADRRLARGAADAERVPAGAGRHARASTASDWAAARSAREARRTAVADEHSPAQQRISGSSDGDDDSRTRWRSSPAPPAASASPPRSGSAPKARASSRRPRCAEAARPPRARCARPGRPTRWRCVCDVARRGRRCRRPSTAAFAALRPARRRRQQRRADGLQADRGADRRRLAAHPAASTCSARSTSPSRRSCAWSAAARSSTSRASTRSRRRRSCACYAAAKAALLSLTRSAALEGKPKGIRVNAILPGAIDTPMLWENPNIKSGAETIDPADVGKPEDIAAAIAYLALRRRAVRAGRDGAGRRRAPQSPLTPLRRLGRSHPTRPRAACQLI